ncbi:hypothetical protein NDU88_005204 [Pleurodeles waltl]|uniref:Retrotransposon gag domain-containing protein n=1 Tax=Pleurodeles waltl TaxID=8319 RepID=A0AAV7V788_PLEWA|nr:hypothetical protein NDU88_005204 [Pleurodeles waltl]
MIQLLLPTTDPVELLENYFVATCEWDGAVQSSLLLHFAWDEVYKLFRHLPNTGAHDDYAAAVRALNAHFDPQLKPNFERFKLRQVRQRKGETINQFHPRICELESACMEDNQQKGIRAQVTGVAGTMVTAEKGRESWTRNISWFRKATFVEHSDELAGDD